MKKNYFFFYCLHFFFFLGVFYGGRAFCWCLFYNSFFFVCSLSLSSFSLFFLLSVCFFLCLFLSWFDLLPLCACLCVVFIFYDSFFFWCGVCSLLLVCAFLFLFLRVVCGVPGASSFDPFPPPHP